LLAAGQRITNADRMQELGEQPLFSEDSESAAWYRRLAAAVNERYRLGAQLGVVAQARAEDTVRGAVAARQQTLAKNGPSLSRAWTRCCAMCAPKATGASASW
jgi:hypothetical protein